MYTSIVVGTDGSETAQQAVRQAGELAASAGARLTVVSAYRPISNLSAMALSGAAMGMVVPPIETLDTQQQEAELVLKQACRDLSGVSALEQQARCGEPAEVLLSAADEVGADLIVVGSRGLRGAGRFLLGSVPNRVVHHATCSVLVVHTS